MSPDVHLKREEKRKSRIEFKNRENMFWVAMIF